VPLTVVHVHRGQPDLLLLSSQGVQVVAEAKAAAGDLEDPVLPVVLVGHTEQLALLLPSPESQLDLCGEPVRLEAEGIFHVGLLVESAGHGLQGAERSSPARITFTGGGPQGPNTAAVLSTSGVLVLIVAHLLSGTTTWYRVARKSWLGEIVEL